MVRRSTDDRPVRPVIRGRHSLSSLAIAGIGLLLILGGRSAVLALQERHATIVTPGAGPLTPSKLKSAAASLVETATAPGGGGLTFEVVQRSTMVAKPDGPKIEIPDPNDRHKSLGFADTYEQGTLIERGAVTPDGFWMEMREGPTGDAAPDWNAPYAYGALVRDGTTYRNDGEGWYETDDPPGIGLDPKTASLLPSLLRDSKSPVDKGSELVGDISTRKIQAEGVLADMPGIVSVDGASFTEISRPVDFAFDDAGRLVKLHVLARNMNMTDFDLLVDTVITFAYPAVAEPLPPPEPRYTQTSPLVKP
jgi:hypothetical protein